jgi:putative ABC transport system permease protein
VLLSKRTPLAWYNLTQDWRKLAVALAGIGFAVLLMFMQVGFQNALFDSQVKMIDELAGDIFLVSRAKFTLASEKRFPLEMVKRATSCAGVAGAYPVYTDLTFSRLKNLSVNNAGKGYPIRSIGFHLSDPVFLAADINSQLERLRPPGTALIDMHSKRENFDFPYDDDAGLAKVPVELGERRISLVGTFDLGTDFAHDGNLVMSAENFALYLPQRQSGDPLSVVDIGIVRLQEGASIDDVRQAIDDMLDDRIWVFTREQFRNAEISFWDDSTPIGIVFAAGKVIGFVVGMVICYQVIYSDIADHMPEFATLKAMGYSSRYFMGLIVAEAVLLSLIGFLPGLAISAGLYVRVASATGLLMRMTPDVMALVLLLTVAMCIASGILAVRKLLAADPATLF